MKAELKAAMIFVKDLARMRAFYEQALGLEVVGDVSEGWVPLRGVSLHQIPAAIAASVDATTPREDSALKLVFRVDSVSEARAHLSANGATMREVTSWGSCDGFDPEGNVFQLVTW